MTKVFKRSTIAAGCAAILAATAPQAYAAETTADFTVSITVLNACSIVSASNLTFDDDSDQFATDSTKESTISVLCSPTTPYTVGLNEGAGAGATTSARVMTGAGGTINYGLFRDASYTLNWGDNIGVDTAAQVGTGLAQAFTVYGRVPSGQGQKAPGTYTDTIQVTVTY